MYEAKGVLKYSPKRQGDEKYGKQNWWLVLELPNRDLGYYYRNLYSLSVNKTSRLIRSSWNEHITIVRGASERPKPELEHLWGIHSGKEFRFFWWHNVQTNGCHYWLPVHFNAGFKLREELGIKKEPVVPFHLTFGCVSLDNEGTM